MPFTTESGLDAAAAYSVWRFRDGKPGHENQTAGLIAALRERVRVELHELDCGGRLGAVPDWLLGRYPPGRGLPPPDLLIGAGHATHFPLLAARRAHGGRSIVLMKPSLPARWFDLCVVPAHDRVPPGDNIFPTLGVLNRIRPAVVKDRSLGLLLIGGPSRHHGWEPGGMIEQVTTIVARSSRHHWELTSSRRTPDGWLAALREQLAPALRERLSLHDWRELEPDWLAQKLALADTVWVGEDSVSMIYEALTAGAAVGLLAMPVKRPGRVSRGVDSLAADGRVVRYNDWLNGRKLEPMPAPLDEAGRCAEEILRRWPKRN